MTTQYRFSIVIPAHNEAQYIGQCLTSIREGIGQRDDVEVIVVDNGSSDNTVALARGFAGVQVLEFPDGKVGAVRNHGARHSRGEFLVFIDGDCLLSPDWLAHAEALIAAHPGSVFGGGCKLRPDPVWVEKYWLLSAPDRPTTLPSKLIGASILIARHTFETLGGFNEQVSSGEDSMLSDQVTQAGLPLRFDDRLSVVHLGNALTLGEFVRRQSWHAENYLARIEDSIRDPVFLLVSVFLVCLLTALAALALLPPIGLGLLVFSLLLPLVLTAKRLLRAGFRRPPGPAALVRIYLLDLAYLVGRSLGILKGLRNRQVA